MDVTITADLTKFAQFAKTLEKADATVVRWRVRKAVNDAGAAMLTAARSKASWSRTIPGATKLKTSLSARSASVKMTTDRKKAPYALYYERGSRGSGGRYVRHPVYGSPDGRAGGVVDRYENKRTWRNTPTRPFFYQSLKAPGVKFEERMRQELDAAMHELGFH